MPRRVGSTRSVEFGVGGRTRAREDVRVRAADLDLASVPLANSRRVVAGDRVS